MTSTSTLPADILDEEWLAAPARRSRIRDLLVVLLVSSLIFLTGVLAQREFGAAGSTPAAGGFPAGSGRPAGLQIPGAEASGTGAQPQSTATAASAVIGTVESVEGEVWTIKDLGGTIHQIKVSATVRVVRESPVAPADVETGATVDVSGTTEDTGQVTATTITIR